MATILAGPASEPQADPMVEVMGRLAALERQVASLIKDRASSATAEDQEDAFYETATTDLRAKN